jgi:hypothetical protein
MTGTSIVNRFAVLPNRLFARRQPSVPLVRPDLHRLWQQRDQLPAVVTQCAPAMRYLDLLGPLAWQDFPERDLQRNWGQTTIPYAAFAASYLIKLQAKCSSMGDLGQYLLDQPLLIWLTGFPLVSDAQQPYGFNAPASLPTTRHLTRLLRSLPNPALQFLLADSVRLILAELARQGLPAPQCVAVDTKHIIAWAQENNPKAYVQTRFDKKQQPQGDPDCKLGCKRRHNQVTKAPTATSTTPTSNPLPAARVQVGEFYWGYGSGVVAVHVADFGDFVLAELTQTFDHADVSYFFPLMKLVEERLGYRPRWAALDAAFDAWYVHAYFHRDDDPAAFAAVPFVQKGRHTATQGQFSPDGLPLCEAGLPMPLQIVFTDRTSCIIEHERGKYGCPLRFPQQTAEACPSGHKNWAKGGCTAMMPTSIGARLRYTLDRNSQAYKQVYNQRTAAERINSQAVALGIERPHIRNGAAIANLNTLTYILINLRFLQRLQQRPIPTC